MELMLDSTGLNVEERWLFGQDIYEIISSCLCKGDFENHDLIDKVLSITNDLQSVVDRSGLADTMLVLAKKSS